MPFKPSRVVLVVLSLLFLFASAESNLRSAIANAASRRLGHSDVESMQMESNRRRGPALTQLAAYKQQGSSRVSFAGAKSNANNGGGDKKPQN